MPTTQTANMKIPAGSVVLVPGAAGFIASHAIKQLLERDPLLQGFSGNIVSPSGVIGEPLHMKHCNKHHNWITTIYKDLRDRLDAIPGSRSTILQRNHL